MGETVREHWSKVYEQKAASELSWYQAVPRPSRDALARIGASKTSSLIDIGGGASSLVDSLLEDGWDDLTVLDIAPSAVERVKERLSAAAWQVRWEIADVTQWLPPRAYDLWHDRAVFHFLTEAGQRDGYRRALQPALRPGGHLIIATFALQGPSKCSGLPVQRYDPAGLSRVLGPSFALVDSWTEEHRTPSAATQLFNWCIFERRP